MSFTQIAEEIQQRAYAEKAKRKPKDQTTEIRTE